MPRKPILFIAPTRIGDAVLAASLLRHIQQTQPDAKVTIVTSALAAPLYAGYPQLDRIIPIVKKPYNKHWLEVWKYTVGTRWDAVWDMRGSIISYVVSRRLRHTYVPPKEIAPKVVQYQKAFGLPSLPPPVLWPTAADTQAATALMADKVNYLILAPIANWAPKEWPITAFIALAELLLNGACAGYRPVIICAGHERERAQPLLDALAAYDPLDLTNGDAPLLTIYACMERAHGFIGNDSGLMHMAAAAGIPTLGLFGPTPADVYQPWGNTAKALRAPDNDMAQLIPEAVAQVFEGMLPPRG
ncbi:MAG: glycosyltransferase family 9 protein [Pseudomonadota bacterium]